MLVAPVRKEVVIEASQAHAFRVFTESHGAWWPLETHHVGGRPAETAVIEPRAGGRWYECAADGTECEWGKVLVWDPPGRLVLQWQIGTDWKYDPLLETEVEVRFVAMSPTRTRVELEHRHLDRMGPDGQSVRDAIDSPGGWGGILQLFAETAGKHV